MAPGRYAVITLTADAPESLTRTTPSQRPPLRVGLVFYVAVASFAGLLVLIGQRFSVFGTTPMIESIR